MAAYAYDSSRDDTIAQGVTVAGVDVGGMKVDQARHVIARELREPLEKPIAVVHAGKHFRLSAQDAGVHADVEGMVDEALAKSREGNIVTRVARDLTGGEEEAQVPARVTYDQDAIDALVKRVSRGLDQRSPRRPGGLPVAPRGQGAERGRGQVGRAAPAARPGPHRAGRGSPGEGARAHDQAEGHRGPAGRQVPGRC